MIIGYLRLQNDLSASSQREEKFETIKDWSFGMQCNGNAYDGVSVPARESAITVVGLNEGTFFSFNGTYVNQVQKVCELFSETVKKFPKNSSSVKIWKILPYKELYKEPSGLIDDKIKKSFPKANVDAINLKKGYCFQIDRSGNEALEYKPEPFYKKTARSISKCYSVLSCQEDKFKL